MRVFVKWQRGGDAGTVDLDGDDSLWLVRQKVAAAAGVHPTLQMLVFHGARLEESDDKSVRDYGIGIEDDLLLASRPCPRVQRLDVGGTTYTTLLSTLRKIEGSRLARTFDGREHEHTETDTGLSEGVPGEMSTLLAPRMPDGTVVIDRNGELFRYVLDYLRDAAPVRLPQEDGEPEPEPEAAEQPATSTEELERQLPAQPEELCRLAREADHYELPGLAEACRSKQTRLSQVHIAVSSLVTLVSSCGPGFTVDDVLGLSEVELQGLLVELQANLLVRNRVTAEVEAERRNRQAVLEAEQAAQRLLAAVVEAGCAMSEAGARVLHTAGLGVADLYDMDAAAVQQQMPLLSAEDARLVAELERPPEPPQVALWQGAKCYTCGESATRTTPHPKEPNRNDKFVRGGHSGICAKQRCLDAHVATQR